MPPHRNRFQNNKAPNLNHKLNDEDHPDSMMNKSISFYKCHNECNNCLKIFSEIEPYENHFNLQNVSINGVRNINVNTINTNISSKHQDDYIKLYCSICNFISNEETGLIVHSTMIHCDINPFKCISCDDEYPTYIHLKKHLEVHLESNNISCRRCSDAINIEEVMFHLNLCRRKRPYECLQCLKCFEINETRLNHENRHNKMCDYCNMCFFLYEDYEKHLKEVHVMGNLRSEEVDTTTNLEPVMDYEAVTKKPCNDLALNKENQHISNNAIKHRNNKTQRNGMICLYCPEILPTIAALENHCSKVHEQGLIYECFTCNKRFSSIVDRRYHLRQNHSGSIIVCKYCNDSLPNEIVANMHVLNCTARSKTSYERFTTNEPTNKRKLHLYLKQESCSEVSSKICKKYIYENDKNTHVLDSIQTSSFNQNHCDEEEQNDVISIIDSESDINEDLLEPLHSDYEDNYNDKESFDGITPVSIPNKSPNSSQDDVQFKQTSPKWCSYCATTFDKICLLVSHTRKVHNTLLIHECYSCDKVFHSVCDRQTHLRTVHGVQKNGSIMCKYCQMLIFQESNMNIHYFQCKREYWLKTGDLNEDVCESESNSIDNTHDLTHSSDEDTSSDTNQVSDYEMAEIDNQLQNIEPDLEISNQHSNVLSSLSQLYPNYNRCKLQLKDVFIDGPTDSEECTENSQNNQTDQSNQNKEELQGEEILNSSEENKSKSMIKVSFKDTKANESQNNDASVFIQRQVVLTIKVNSANEETLDRMAVDHFDINDAIDIDDTGFDPKIEEHLPTNPGNDILSVPSKVMDDVGVEEENEYIFMESESPKKDVSVLNTPNKIQLSSSKLKICLSCNRKFSSDENLIKHHMMVHRTVNKSHLCNLCFKEFSTEYDKINHNCN